MTFFSGELYVEKKIPGITIIVYLNINIRDFLRARINIQKKSTKCQRAYETSICRIMEMN